MDRSIHGAFGRAQAKEDVLTMLRKKSGSSLDRTRLAAGLGFDRNDRADGVPITLHPAKSKCDRGREIGNHVFQNAQLGGVAILEEEFLAAVVIEIGESK